VFDFTNLKGEKKRNVGKLNNELNIINQLVKLLLLSVPKVTTCSLYPECIANLKLPIDAFYRESRSGVNIAKRNITTGLFWLYLTK
jgi:nitrate reductase beta subunit